MNDEKERFFTVIDEQEQEIEYEILFTFDLEETGKSYIVFTDNKEDQNGALMTYAAIYDKEGKDLSLQSIETEKEWNMVENLLSHIEEKQE